MIGSRRVWMQLVGLGVLGICAAGCPKSTSDMVVAPGTGAPSSGPSLGSASAVASAAGVKAPPPALGMRYAQVNGKCVVPPTDTQSPVPPEPASPGMTNECEKDAQCTQGKNPRCRSVYVGHGRSRKTCTADLCERDSDCPTGKRCFCGGNYNGRNGCFPSNCRKDADCEAGYVCGLAGMSGGSLHPPAGSFCRSSKDTCVDDSDCVGKDPAQPRRICDYAPMATRFECLDAHFPPPG